MPEDRVQFNGFGSDFMTKHPASVLEAHSLAKRADLNGERVVMISHVHPAARYSVRVVRTGEEVKIKPQNVLLVGVDDEVGSPGERLFLACMVGDTFASIVEHCLKQEGVTLDHIDADGGATPLSISCFRGQLECVKLLLHAKASVNFKDELIVTNNLKGPVNGGAPPLLRACTYLAGTPEMIRDVSCVQPVACGAALSVLKLLLDAKANPDQAFTLRDQASSKGQSFTVLSKVCAFTYSHGHLECCVEQLLSAKADVNCNSDLSPLMNSCCGGHVSIAQKLLQAGASIDMKDERNGCSALHYACMENQPACAKLLIDAGADLSSSTPDGGTPIIYCGNAGKASCLRELIAARADIDYQDISGETALSLSATKGARCPFHRATSPYGQGLQCSCACAFQGTSSALSCW